MNFPYVDELKKKKNLCIFYLLLSAFSVLFIYNIYVHR